MTRVVAWNVHHCRGLDLKVAPGRIVDLVAALEPDIVALQELDIDRARSKRLDQPAWLADRLAMHVEFAETMPGYGHALLSRQPPASATVVPFTHTPLTEPRCAIEACVGGLRVLATHLGLTNTDRAAQVDELVARANASTEPVLVLGDLNAGPGEIGYEELLRASFRDPLGHIPTRARATWPALLPFRPLDHVLVGPSLAARRIEILGRGKARYASDHRPLVADIVPRQGTPLAHP